MTKLLKAAVLALGLVLAPVTQAWSETIPEPAYIVLSEHECDQVAVLVALHMRKLQGEDQDKLETITKGASHNVQSVTKYMVEKNPNLADMDTPTIYNLLLVACLNAGGETVVPEHF
jgi:tRNA isopentenyl-2-thiomethyl-A-37 hydroxylase MiaE